MTQPYFRHCKICYRRMPRASTGRPRLTCSDRCRQIKSRGPIDDFERKRQRARQQIRRYEQRFGDLSQIPAYRHADFPPDDPRFMSLRDLLMIYLPRGIPFQHCWMCDRPYFPDGQQSPTCSDHCTRRRSEYFHKLKAMTRPLSEAVKRYIKANKRLAFCAHCDYPYIPTRPDRKYCSPNCRKLAWWHHRKFGFTPKAVGWHPKRKTCKGCGTHFYPKSSAAQRSRLYCTTTCYERSRTPRRAKQREAHRPVRFCAYCHDPLPAKNTLRKYCANCRRIADRDKTRRYRERLTPRKGGSMAAQT